MHLNGARRNLVVESGQDSGVLLVALGRWHVVGVGPIVIAFLKLPRFNDVEFFELGYLKECS